MESAIHIIYFTHSVTVEQHYYTTTLFFLHGHWKYHLLEGLEIPSLVLLFHFSAHFGVTDSHLSCCHLPQLAWEIVVSCVSPLIQTKAPAAYFHLPVRSTQHFTLFVPDSSNLHTDTGNLTLWIITAAPRRFLIKQHSYLESGLINGWHPV